MGRTREFDRDVVLWEAVDLFRHRGYRNVSIADLEKATGLVSGSIYNAFGDKAGLFEAALHHYIEKFVTPRLQAFAGAEARLEELEQLFLTVFEPALADGGGCLVTNSVIEFGTSDASVARELSAVLDLVRSKIGGVITRELGPADAPAATMRLVLLYHGMLTLSRSATPLPDMAAAIRAEFTTLRAARDRVSPSPK